TVAQKAQVQESEVAILSKSEEELRGRLETQLALIIAEAGPETMPSFGEAFTTAAIIINEVRNVVGDREDYEPSDQLVTSLAKRFETAGWTEDKVRQALKGAVVGGAMGIPAQPLRSDPSELDALGDMELELLGQSA
ncbi:MAG: hypothetical protein Q8Q33_11020, partial [Chlamydiota bacterium]|nr:hypothetical protein [Chlamydiota bacterium]